MSLSQRIRIDVECAPWVIVEVNALEASLADITKERDDLWEAELERRRNIGKRKRREQWLRVSLRDSKERVRVLEEWMAIHGGHSRNCSVGTFDQAGTAMVCDCGFLELLEAGSAKQEALGGGKEPTHA